MPTKYQAISVVNRWRQKYQSQKLPNNTPQKTIYYGKVLLWINSQNPVDFDFAMGAYLFELEYTDAIELNKLQENIKVQRSTSSSRQARQRAIRNAAGGYQQKYISASDLKKYYDERNDLAILKSTFADEPEIWDAVLSGDQGTYDSEQIKRLMADFPGDKSEVVIFYEEAMPLEFDAINFSYPGINVNIFIKKINQLGAEVKQKPQDYINIKNKKNYSYGRR